METLELKIAAATAGLVDGFEPEYWTVLDDPRGPRVLVTGGGRSVVAALLRGEEIADVAAEDLGAAVMRSLLPDSTAAFPQVIASQMVPAEQFGGEGDPQLHVAEPLPGIPVASTAFAESEALVESLAAFLAALHDADSGIVADSGMPVADAAEARQKLLDDLDRGADTGRIPPALLGRWESALENVATWRFLPCPVHGRLSEDALRTTQDELTSVSELAGLSVGDPAVDLAAISVLLDPSTLERFLRAYRRLRQVSDPGLRGRMEVLSEFAALDWLLAADASGDEAELADATELLASLAELTADDDAPRHREPYATGDAPDAEPEPGAPDDPGVEAGAATQVMAGAEESPAAPDRDPVSPSIDDDRALFRLASRYVDEDAASAVPTERIEDLDDSGDADPRPGGQAPGSAATDR